MGILSGKELKSIKNVSRNDLYALSYIICSASTVFIVFYVSY